MKYKKIILLSVLLLSPLKAYSIDFGVGFKAGSTGHGLDLSLAIAKTVNIRASLTSLTIDDFEETFELNENGNRAEFVANAGLGLATTALLIDWYVFDGTFHLTAGMIKNDTVLNFDGIFTNQQVTFDGEDYSVARDFLDPSIRGSISFGDSFGPYVGIGWGRKASNDPGLSFTVEMGVMLLSPSINLTAPQLRLNNSETTFLYTQANQDDLNAVVNNAEPEINEELAIFELWPVLTIGLNYAF